MAGLPYVAKNISGPPKSKSGKIPYLERPDGSLLSDSSVIIETLTREHAVKLDSGLSSAERAQSILLQRLFEEELYFHLLYDRWFDPAGWQVTEPAYFKTLPWILRATVVPVIRRQLIGARIEAPRAPRREQHREHRPMRAHGAPRTGRASETYSRVVSGRSGCASTRARTASGPRAAASPSDARHGPSRASAQSVNGPALSSPPSNRAPSAPAEYGPGEADQERSEREKQTVEHRDGHSSDAYSGAR